MDDLRNSINASSEIQDLRSQLNKKYSEEEVIKIANWAFGFHRRNDLSDDELEDEFNKILFEQFKKNNL